MEHEVRCAMVEVEPSVQYGATNTNDVPSLQTDDDEVDCGLDDESVADVVIRWQLQCKMCFGCCILAGPNKSQPMANDIVYTTVTIFVEQWLTSYNMNNDATLHIVASFTTHSANCANTA